MKKIIKITTAAVLSTGLLFGGLGMGLSVLIPHQNQQLQLNSTIRAVGTEIVDGGMETMSEKIASDLKAQDAGTSYIVNSPSTVPADISPTAFVSKLKTDGAIEGMSSYLELNSTNIDWLEQFGTFNNIYVGSTLYFKMQHVNDMTGSLVFEPTADIYYTSSGAETGFLGGGADVFGPGLPYINFTLSNDTYIPPKTDIQTILESPKIDDEATFLSSIKNADGSWNITELSKYVSGLDTIPTLATIEDVAYIGELDSEVNLLFAIKISGWWNGENFAMEPSKTIEFTTNNEKIKPVSRFSDQFPWWWIVIAISGAAFIGLVIWFSMKKPIDTDDKSTDGKQKQEVPKDEEKKLEEKKTSESKTNPIDAKKKVEKAKTSVSKPKQKDSTPTNNKSIDKPVYRKKVNVKPKPKSPAKKPSTKAKAKK